MDVHQVDYFKALSLFLSNVLDSASFSVTSHSKLWKEELSLKWPRSYWDDWMREPGQRRGRACIRPEISRTKTFGKVGVSNGLFYDKHLKYIKLNDRAVDFGKRDLGFLRKGPYDAEMTQKLMQVPVVSLEQIRTGDAAAR